MKKERKDEQGMGVKWERERRKKGMKKTEKGEEEKEVSLSVEGRSCTMNTMKHVEQSWIEHEEREEMVKNKGLSRPLVPSCAGGVALHLEMSVRNGCLLTQAETS